MRILHIRFRNLNSLAGQWEIDLTHPAFTSDGIFAITGPTGAGKTTILDAICLALYGRTPRLGRITRSGNEIMSRQTGECFAEVTFETPSGCYRCHWSQRRSRKKPNGELQAPRHEIANADTGEIFEVKLREVADQIEAVTGMDFDRFTRSMLLAQGGFAAFLQAAPDERAPILEQITGTEIYSRISIRVHERRSEERKRLDALEAELAGIRLITPEDAERLAEALAQKIRRDDDITGQIARIQQAVVWSEGVIRLEEELKEITQANDALKARTETFTPDQKRLDAAVRALELAADHAALTAVRSEQTSDKAALDECRSLMPDRTQAAAQAEDAMKTAALRLETGKAELQKSQPLLRQVRELDLKITEKCAPIDAANKAIAVMETDLEALRITLKKNSGELVKKRETLSHLQRLLEASGADEALVEHLAGTRSRFENFKLLNARMIAGRDEVVQAEKQIRKASDTLRQQVSVLEGEQRKRDELQKLLTEQQRKLLETLGGREAADWRRGHSLAAALGYRITAAIEAAQILSESGRTAAGLAERQTALSAEASALAETLSVHEERKNAIEKELELLETQLTLLKRIEALEDARIQLRDGAPCPLCGALEHPFAEGNVPAPDETRKRLIAVRKDLKSVTAAVSELKVKLAKLGKDIDQAISGQKEHTERAEAARRRIGETCAELPPEQKPDADDPDLSEKLRALQKTSARRLAQTVRVLETAESAEKSLAMLRTSLDTAADSVMKAEREAQAAALRQDAAVQLCDRLKTETATYREQRESALLQLRDEVGAFGIETLSADTLDDVFGQLTARRKLWTARQKEKISLEQRIAALETQARHQAEQMQKSEDDLNNRQTQRRDLLRERTDLTDERRAHFGDKRPDDEEQRLISEIETAEAELNLARQRQISASRALDHLKTRIGGLEQAIGARERHMALMAEAFGIRLGDFGFSGEESYRSACLPENERNHLTQQSRKLSDEKTELTSREREKTGLLESERRKRITEESLDDLHNTLTALAGSQKEFQQEIGGIRQKLTDNENLKTRQQERLCAADAQKRECVRWELLHELIGSADGKKYRNFAQGLTFEMMIGHANRQLQKMSDRYLLIRDDAQPLELNVIDNYQAGEIRSTKNLSGGESFIVSLSLALGLSHMAGRNIRVDSLFLDEGFGTLDEEALETALETLSALRQDGKLIGVISHVAALQERIGIRIQVTPITGGKSRISGPGCRKTPPFPDG